MKILAFMNGWSGIAYHRIYAPLSDLQKRGYCEVDLYHFTDAQGRPQPLPPLEGYDLAVFSQTLGVNQKAILQRFEEADLPYIVDVDDYWMLNRYNPANTEWQRMGMAAKVQEAIYWATGVTVENERLAKMVNRVNRNYAIVPNALDMTELQWNNDKRPSDKFRVGFVGGRGHRYDLLMIADALRKFAEAWPDIEINLCGYDPKDIEWTTVGNAIAPDGHPEWLKLRPSAHPTEYGGFYAGLDVIVCPLISNQFNEYKSDLKVKEAGIYSLPVIASNIGPYRDCPSKGVRKVQGKPGEWFAALNEAYAGKIDGRANAAYVQDEGALHLVNQSRIEFYWTVLQAVMV